MSRNKKFRPKLEPLRSSDRETGRGKRKPPKFAVCDIEAHDWINFKLIGYYDGQEYQEFRTLYDFIDFCWEVRHEKQIKEIYAHFGGIYDFMFIIEECLRQGLCIGDIVPRGSGFLCFSVWKRGDPETKITFKDSSALFPFGLEKLTKSFGVTHVKQDFDFAKWDGSITQKLCDYLKYDCVGLWECIDAYRKWPLIKRAGPASTMASQAMRVLRTFIYSPMKSPSDDVDAFVRKAYLGGRTEVFKPFFDGTKTGKTLKAYDVNSLYPTVMREDMPGDCIGWSNLYQPSQMGFYEATVEIPKGMKIPPLPAVVDVGSGDKLIFPTGILKGVWSTMELEYAKTLGVKVISTGLGVLFKNYGPLFRFYIDELYEMRLEAKAKGDGVGDVLTKLLMNSAYGRFGLNKEKEEIMFDDFSEGLKFHSEIEVDGEHYRLMTKSKTLDKTFTNVAVAAWVTSLARIHMHKLFMECGDELYYTDTDSIFTTAEFSSGAGLGELKLEYETDRAVFLLPKTYLVEKTKGDPFKKVAMKGFSSRKIGKFTFDDFFTALEGDLRHMKVVHDEKMATMKTALKRFNKIVAKMPAQEKGLKSLYDKRTVFRKGSEYDSRPLHVEGGLVQ